MVRLQLQPGVDGKYPRKVQKVFSSLFPARAGLSVQDGPKTLSEDALPFVSQSSTWAPRPDCEHLPTQTAELAGPPEHPHGPRGVPATANSAQVPA